MVLALSEGWNDVLVVAGVVLAAIAALTGIVSVLQGRRSWRLKRLPHLQAFATRNLATNGLQIVIQNTGAAPARDPRLLFFLRDMYVTGPASPGLLGPGREVGLQVDAPIQDNEQVGGVMACSSQDERRVCAWTIRGNSCHWRHRPWSKVAPTISEIFAQRYPGVDISKKREISYTLEGPR